MSKRYLQITLHVEVESGLSSVDNIIDNLDYNIESISENVEVKRSEISDFFLTDPTFSIK